MNLKEALLSFDGVIDNEYLDQYIELVSDTYSFSGEDYTERHHVIPAAFYKIAHNCNSREVAEYQFANKDINNFIVKLLYKDHCKAHWFLYKCTTGQYQAANAAAFRNMLGRFKSAKFSNGISDKEYAELQDYRNSLLADSPTAIMSPEQRQWLIDNYYLVYTPKECAEFLKLPQQIVNLTAFRLGLTARGNRCKRKRPELQETDTWLLENYLAMSVEECCSILNLPRTVIYSRAAKLGLKRGWKGIHKKAVLCLETGIAYNSFTEAAKSVNVTKTAIWNQLNGKTTTCGGYHWKYAD